MKLYLISQTQNNGYDTYDSAVVAAENEEDARNTNPGGLNWPDELVMTEARWRESYNAWCDYAHKVDVTYLGEAVEGTPRSVICASFNAG